MTVILALVGAISALVLFTGTAVLMIEVAYGDLTERVKVWLLHKLLW